MEESYRRKRVAAMIFDLWTMGGSDDSVLAEKLLDGDRGLEVIIETTHYHMIGMHFTIKHCIRVP